MRSLKLFILLICSIFSLNLQAQQLVPFLQDSLYGFANIEGELQIDAIYNEVTFFDNDGIAHVRKDEKWSIINQSGELLIPFEANQIAENNLIYGTPFNNKDGKIKIIPAIDYNSKFTPRNKPSIDLSYDTISHLKFIFRSRTKFQLLNLNNWELSQIFDFSGQLQRLQTMGYCPPMSLIPHFGKKIFTGKDSNRAYSVFNTKGEIIIQQVEFLPKMLNDELLTYCTGEESVILNINTLEKKNLPFITIHQICHDSFYIVSNTKEQQKNGWISFERKKMGLTSFEGKIVLDTLFNLIGDFGNGLFYTWNDKDKHLYNSYGQALYDTAFLQIMILNANTTGAQLQNKQWILLDKNGKRANFETYTTIKYADHEQFYYFTKNNIAGILDKNLQEEITFECNEIFRLSNSDLYVVKKNDFSGVINAKKELILPFQFDYTHITTINGQKYIKLNLDDKKGLADMNGHILFEPIYRNIKVKEMDDAIYFITAKDSTSVCYDSELNKLNELKGEAIEISRRPIRTEYNNGETSYYSQFGKPMGFISKNYSCGQCGYVTTDSIYLCPLFKDNKGYLMKANGEFINPEGFWLNRERGKQVRSNELVAFINEEKQGVYSYRGEWIIEPGYYEVFLIKKDFIVLKQKGKYFIYDTKGKLMYEEGFSSVGEYYYNSDLRRVSITSPSETYGHIAQTCSGVMDTTIRNCKYFGFINKTGTLTVPLIYSYLSQIETYIFATKGFKNGKKTSFIFDKNNNLLLETEYDKIYLLSKSSTNVYFKIIKNGKTGIINLQGDIILPPIYEWVERMIGNMLFAVKKEDDRWYLINKNGEIIISDINIYTFSYNNYNKISEDMFLVSFKDKTAIINHNGQIMKTINSQEVKLFHFDLNNSYNVSGPTKSIFEMNTEKLFLEVIENGQKYYINCSNFVEYRK